MTALTPTTLQLLGVERAPPSRHLIGCTPHNYKGQEQPHPRTSVLIYYRSLPLPATTYSRNSNMRPILLQGHERALTQIKYNRDGDIIFSTAKDQHICAWFSHNGERLGTYHGHQGALWTVDVDPTSTLIASGAADNTVKLWDIKSGKCLKTWDFDTAVKRVEFNEDGSLLLAVTEMRMGFLGTIVVLKVNLDPEAEQASERVLTIECDESKATVAGWSYLSKFIIAGHLDGSVSQYDPKVGISASM